MFNFFKRNKTNTPITILRSGGERLISVAALRNEMSAEDKAMLSALPEIADNSGVVVFKTGAEVNTGDLIGTGKPPQHW